MTQPLHEPTPKIEPDEPAPGPDEPIEPYESFESLDSFDLEDRQALRRVAGLATELEDITEVEYRQLRLERVVLVGVWTDGTVEDAENSMAELARLAETAGSEVLDGLMQRREQPRPGDVHRLRQGQGGPRHRRGHRRRHRDLRRRARAQPAAQPRGRSSRSRSSTGPR